MRARHVLALALAVLGTAADAAAAELTVFVTGSMADPLEHVAEDFTQATGHTLRFESATTGGLLGKIRAGAISYPDPVAATVSGGYIETVFTELGIKDAARAKASLKPMGYLVGEAVASGEAELGLSFISEFVGNPALQAVPFPEALQKLQLYSAGVFAESANAAAARELVAFITGAAARAKLAAAGVVPAAQN